MDDARKAPLGNDLAGYRGLRDWLEKVDGLGELLRVDGADWDAEMGSITQMLTEKSRGNAPAILFDEVPGYPKGYRTLYGSLSSVRRVALTLGLPLEHERKVDIVMPYDAKAAATAAKLGQVFVDANRTSKATAAIKQLADRVVGASEAAEGEVESGKKSLLGSFDIKSLLPKKEKARKAEMQAD